MSVVSLVIKSVAELPVSVLMLAMVSTCAGLTVSICADWLPVAPTLPAKSTTRTCQVVVPLVSVRPSTYVQFRPSAATVTFTQVAPLSVLICANSLAPSAAPSTPRTVSVVSLVIKSLLLAPVSSLIPVIVMLFAASGLMVSTTTFCVAVCPTFPARSTTRTV